MIKIAIPSNDEVHVAPHFGRAEGFLVFNEEGDIRTKEYRRVGPKAEGCCGDGDGVSRHELIVRTIGDCNLVVASGMGAHMIETLSAAGLEIAFTEEEVAWNAIEHCRKLERPNVSPNTCTCSH